MWARSLSELLPVKRKKNPTNPSRTKLNTLRKIAYLGIVCLGNSVIYVSFLDILDCQRTGCCGPNLFLFEIHVPHF